MKYDESATGDVEIVLSYLNRLEKKECGFFLPVWSLNMDGSVGMIEFYDRFRREGLVLSGII